MPRYRLQSEQQMTFKSDDFVLQGTLHLPAAPDPPVVIGCHGLLSDRSSPKQIALARRCKEAGLAFFRFDHRGCGDSEGRFTDVTSFQARCRDALSGLEKVVSLGFSGARVGLFGSSLGGSVCLEVARALDIPALVTFAAPLRSRLSSASYLPYALDFDLAGGLSQIKNIHIFHGDADQVVPLSHARSIYGQVGEPKRMTIQKDGDHRMSNPSHQKAFAMAAVQWFVTYLR